jgi:hypothetical protein
LTNPDSGEVSNDATAPASSRAERVEKLRRKTKRLRKRKRCKTLAMLMPIITTLVGVAGFFFTVYVFEKQRTAQEEKDRTSRELERRTALKNQISSETDEILRFTGDPKLTVARVAFLLANIQTTLDSPINRTPLDPAENECKKLADVLPKYKDSLTLSLVTMVKNDCDFTRHSRDVELADAVVYYWDDYSTYLTKESKDFDGLDYILWQYIKALESLNDQHPGYLKSFYVKDDRLERHRKYSQRVSNDDSIYSHFMDITEGFKAHLQILCKENLGEKARNVRKIRLGEFRTDLSNPGLVNNLLESEVNDTNCDPSVRKEKTQWQQKRKPRKRVVIQRRSGGKRPRRRGSR